MPKYMIFFKRHTLPWSAWRMSQSSFQCEQRYRFDEECPWACPHPFTPLLWDLFFPPVMWKYCNKGLVAELTLCWNLKGCNLSLPLLTGGSKAIALPQLNCHKTIRLVKRQGYARRMHGARFCRPEAQRLSRPPSIPCVIWVRALASAQPSLLTHRGYPQIRMQADVCLSWETRLWVKHWSHVLV